MSIKGFLFGNSKKKYSEIRNILNQIAEQHGDPNFGKGQDAFGTERSISSRDSNIYGKFERLLLEFLKNRGDLETFMTVMVDLNHQVSNPKQAVKLYVNLFRKEKFEEADAVNRKLSDADKSLAQLLEQGLTELKIAAEKRESR